MQDLACRHTVDRPGPAHTHRMLGIVVINKIVFFRQACCFQSLLFDGRAHIAEKIQHKIRLGVFAHGHSAFGDIQKPHFHAAAMAGNHLAGVFSVHHSGTQGAALGCFLRVALHKLRQLFQRIGGRKGIIVCDPQPVKLLMHGSLHAAVKSAAAAVVLVKMMHQRHKRQGPGRPFIQPCTGAVGRAVVHHQHKGRGQRLRFVGSQTAAKLLYAVVGYNNSADLHGSPLLYSKIIFRQPWRSWQPYGRSWHRSCPGIRPPRRCFR